MFLELEPAKQCLTHTMKRWVRKIGIAVATFAVGCGTYLLAGPIRTLYWRTFGALPYCEVARHAEWYHNSNIVIKTRIIFDEWGVYVYEDCDPNEALAASVVIDGNHPLIGPAYVEKLLVGEKSQLKTAEAVIEGHFDAYATPGCWAPKFRIAATKIELVSPATDYSPPAITGEALRSKH